jgi:hypothetical protein
MIPRTDWIERAACAGLDTRVFFSDGHHGREQVAVARRICAACPVQTECANWAIRTGEYYGVWGGMSQKELRQRRRRFTNRGGTSTRAAA